MIERSGFMDGKFWPEATWVFTRRRRCESLYASQGKGEQYKVEGWDDSEANQDTGY